MKIKKGIESILQKVALTLQAWRVVRQCNEEYEGSAYSGLVISAGTKRMISQSSIMDMKWGNAWGRPKKLQIQNLSPIDVNQSFK